jgi:predicted RNase H-like nuclease
VCLEGNPAQGAVLLAFADALLTDDEILAFVAANDTGEGLLVAIDAPTIVPNSTGRRPCEAILSRCMAKAQAGPHPANRTLLTGTDGTIRGERIANALAAQSIPQTPYLTGLPIDKPRRAAFEVFPHPAHIALFGLEKTLKYKAKPKRTGETRLAEFRRYIDCLSALRFADPPLAFPTEGPLFLEQEITTLKSAALKRYEDTLDALTCAYIALYYHRWGKAKCAILGDLETGFIVTPVSEAMRVCFAAASQGTEEGQP